MRYNTGNPVGPDGSSSPFDLHDNAGNLDLAMNSGATEWIDRTGEQRPTMVGLEQRLDEVIAGSADSVLRSSTSSVPIGSWSESALSVDVDDGGKVVGGNDVVESHEDRLQYVESAAKKDVYPISSWPEISMDVIIDDANQMAGGCDVLESHEARIQSLESGAGAGGIVLGVIGQGQSNARGAGGLPLEAMTLTPWYPDHALMPAGPGMNVAVGTQPGATYDPIVPENFSGFQPLKSMQLSSSNGTTFLEGLAFSQALLHARKGKLTQTLYWTTAKGGVSLADRSPGTTPYQNTLTAIHRSVEIAEGLGKNYEVSAISAVEGEADTSNSTYASDLHQVYAVDLTGDIKSITGQKYDPFIIMTQPSSFFSSVDGVEGIYQVCKNSGRFFLACPGYHLEYGSDLLHYTAKSHAKLGEYIGKALESLMESGSWKPLSPCQIIYDGTNGVEVYFHVPRPPLVLDAFAPNHGDFGFEVYSGGNKQVVTSVQISSPCSIKIKTQSNLGAVRLLKYAMRGYQSSPRTLGDGPMGSLRDSDTTPSFVDGQPLQNWCVHFSEQF
ncbi:sialate O-acetylesterase [Pseudomonas kurunegalensis]|uniref:sialate O-acetylesterase n=1 Tax=Pseudomonas kurunegalensis TaxID=485880 RepID=UPI003A863255